MSHRSTSAKRWSDQFDQGVPKSANNRVEQLRPREDSAPTPRTVTYRTPAAQNELTISYSQRDVETIRSQVIECESLKRRWMVLGLLISTVALVISIVLLSSSYALYARTEAANEQLTLQNSTISQRAAALDQELESRKAQDAERQRAIAEANETLQGLFPSLGSSSVSSAAAGRFARAVYETGGRFETRSKPPDKLFRNWKVTTDTGNEIYTLVGGFVDGNWRIYSNLVARRTNVLDVSRPSEAN